MRMRSITIQRFRSVLDAHIECGPVLALIGRNNSGKSNILRALELFFEPSVRIVDKESFYNHDTTLPIDLWVTFHELQQWERNELGPWMDGAELTVGRRITWNQGSPSIQPLARVRRPTVPWLRDDEVSSTAIDEWWAKRSQLKVVSLSFGDTLGTTKPSVGAWKDKAREFVEEYRDLIPMQEIVLENPKGYANVLKGLLPQFIMVPAVREVTDEAKVTTTSPFGRLINSVLERISEQQKVLVGERLSEVAQLLNRGSAERIAEIQEIEDRLNVLISDIMECDVEIEMSLPQIKEVFGGTTIYADDGTRTTIERKGHGLQRSMILTILRAYAGMVKREAGAGSGRPRTTVLAIEEPELYLHPQSQRTLMAVFRQLAVGQDHVCYSTHSSLFVDVGHFDEVCVIRRMRDEAGRHYSEATQLPMEAMLQDLRLRKGITGTEAGIRELYAHAFNPMINEGFFGDKVVMVEGPSELYALPVYASIMGYDFDTHNVAVVHCDGKGQMDRILRVFSGFGIPTYVIFDGDKANEDSAVTDKTLELLELLGKPVSKIGELKTTVEDYFCVFEHKLECTLEQEMPDLPKLAQEARQTIGPHGKPLMHRYVAKAKARAVDEGARPEDVIPPTVRAIVERVRELSGPVQILRLDQASGPHGSTGLSG